LKEGDAANVDAPYVPGTLPKYIERWGGENIQTFTGGREKKL